jgi:hypothetical protein
MASELNGFRLESQSDGSLSVNVQADSLPAYEIEPSGNGVSILLKDTHLSDSLRQKGLPVVIDNRNRAIGTVLLQVYIDRHWATTYHADALIVATATGSTAYALAAGGPILPPELRNILIVPVAPHLSMDRPIVLSEGATVQVVVSAERESHATVILDGVELCAIEAHDCVLIRVSEHMGRFVRMRDQNYFYRSLLDRLEPRVPLRATPDELVFSLNHKDAKDTP